MLSTVPVDVVSLHGHASSQRRLVMGYRQIVKQLLAVRARHDIPVMLTFGVLLGSVLAVGAQSAAPLRVVYLVNGSLGDKGFYDSAASGLYRMRDELGAEIKIIEMGRDETSYEGNFIDVSEQDWDLIISGTWSVKELAQEIDP